MNWDAIGALAEAAGALAVLLTLIYLALQVRNSVRATKAVVRQGVADSIVRLNLIPVEQPDFGAAVLRFNAGEKEAEDKPRIEFYASAWWRTQENVYFQFRNGLLDEAEWEGHRDSMIVSIQSDIPVWKHSLEMYRNNRPRLSSEFRKLVDTLLHGNA